MQEDCAARDFGGILYILRTTYSSLRVSLSDMSTDLTDARIKLERAGEHIADVERAIINLTSPELYRLTFDHDRLTNFVKVELQSLHVSTKTISALIGDGIGNLRSTLDYLMGPLVQPLGGNPDKVTFPFADDSQGYKGEVKAPTLCFSEELISHFNRIEAYAGGSGHNLWILNKLRNIDKHRLLITVTQLAGVKADWRVGPQEFKNFKFMTRAGEKCVGIQAPASEFEFTSELCPIFSIRFEERSVGMYSEVLPFLQSASRDIENLIDALEKL